MCMSVCGFVTDYCSSLSPNDIYLITIQWDGMTAVMVAAREGHTHTMEALVTAGASHDPQVLRVS